MHLGPTSVLVKLYVILIFVVCVYSTKPLPTDLSKEEKKILQALLTWIIFSFSTFQHLIVSNLMDLVLGVLTCQRTCQSSIKEI